MLRVIIADDEKKICELLKAIVDWKTLGFEIVDIKHDGISLLKAVQEEMPDLIVTDVQMPGMTGLELMHRLREENVNVDIIVISGFREFDYISSSLRDGAVDYLLKPIDRNALTSALNRVREKQEQKQNTEKTVESLERAAESYSNGVKETLAHYILSKHCNFQSNEEMIEKNGLCEQDSFFFATMKVDFADQLNEITREVIEQKIQFITRSEAEKRNIWASCTADGNLFYIFLGSSDREQADEYLNHLIYGVKDYISRWNVCHVTVGVSRIVCGEADTALQASRSAAYHQVFQGTDRIIDSSIYPECSREHGTVEAVEKRFGSAVSEPIWSLISSACSTVGEYVAEQKCGETAALGYSEICNQTQMWCDSHLAEEKVMLYLKNWRLEIKNCFSMKGYEETISNGAAKLKEIIAEINEQKKKQPILVLREYIDHHYAEEITLETIAERAGMSTSYVSRQFKNELGVNFTDYLNEIRIEKAKKELTETDKTLAQIAEDVGISDEKYLMRLFKKKVGLTTKEYRRLYYRRT